MVAKRTRGSGVDASNDDDKGKSHDDLPVGPRAATPAGDAAPPAAPASTGKVPLVLPSTTEREERARAREVLPDLLRSPGLHLLPGLLGRDLQRMHLLRQLLLLLLGLLELLQHPKKHNVNLTEDRFYRSFVNYRCKHGVHQERRGAGKRNFDVNFIGCRVRFNVVLMNVAAPREHPRHRLVVRDEWRMHNHATEHTGTSARAQDVPSEGHVAPTVTTLHKNSVRSGEIAGFLSEQIGRPVSSQPARNFIRELQGEGMAQARLKVLLDTLAAEDGCEVMIIRDQMDVTYAIVVPSAVQKVVFEQWGESLTLDFTHGTNNVGYHLGSCVATTPTGRGFPILDFMSLNEKAVALESIFECF
ncbi:hypothetical protein PR001_g19746 [Phytophthora rubi]|uniref:ZSWIM1/3 RNaseH-like domain-containing protein n=1 Tax=Phytophthora rubi TaxID=129364 RepID=A0A6A3JNJ8_9STRA|nr:hypothetical protein PR001_g19746 [Phytophthora rubi]